MGLKDINGLENEPWVYQNGTLGDENEKPFEYTDDLERINKIRDKAVKDLRVFYEDVKNTSNVKGYTKAIYRLLFDLRIPEK